MQVNDPGLIGIPVLHVHVARQDEIAKDSLKRPRHRRTRLPGTDHDDALI